MIHSITTFTVDAKARTITSELSTVPLENLFPNSGRGVLDNGVRIRSTRTNMIADFVFAKYDHSQGDEPELISITLKPTPATLKTLPHLAGWTVILFND